jgi:hypothetical protein
MTQIWSLIRDEYSGPDLVKKFQIQSDSDPDPKLPLYMMEE